MENIFKYRTFQPKKTATNIKREKKKIISSMKLKQVKPVWLCVSALIIVTIMPSLRQYLTSQFSHTPSPAPERETVLHFFLHDTPGGDNPSAVRVTRPAPADTSVTPFGTVWVVDDPLTEGPDPKSGVVGNSRGMYVSAGREEVMLVAYLDFGFTSGEHEGSSISMVSRNPVTEVEREFAVVGGRGKFRFARGFAKLRCIFFNDTTGDSIVEYTVWLRHF